MKWNTGDRRRRVFLMSWYNIFWCRRSVGLQKAWLLCEQIPLTPSSNFLNTVFVQSNISRMTFTKSSLWSGHIRTFNEIQFLILDSNHFYLSPVGSHRMGSKLKSQGKHKIYEHFSFTTKLCQQYVKGIFSPFKAGSTNPERKIHRFSSTIQRILINYRKHSHPF